MATWCPYIDCDGVRYELHHFHDCFHTYRLPPTTRRPKPRNVIVRVTFGIHCFTRTAKPGETVDPRQIYYRNHEGRIFCPIRWELGKSLPTMCGALLEKNCFQTDRRNHVFFSSAQTIGGDEYAVFFVLRKASQAVTHDVNMMVLSAHPRHGFRPPGQPTKFGYLLGKLV